MHPSKRIIVLCLIGIFASVVVFNLCWSLFKAAVGISSLYWRLWGLIFFTVFGVGFGLRIMFKQKLSLEMQVADMDRFKLEIDNHLAEKQLRPELKAEGRVRLLGWLQLAVSGVLFFLFLMSDIQGQLNILTILLFAFAIGLNFFAGYFSIKRKVLGYWLSIINQSLQTLSFTMGSYLYNYSGIGGVYFYLSETNREIRGDLKLHSVPVLRLDGVYTSKQAILQSTYWLYSLSEFFYPH